MRLVSAVRFCRRCGEGEELADGLLKPVAFDVHSGVVYEHMSLCPVFRLAEELADALQE